MINMNEMTQADFQRLVDEAVDRRLKILLGAFELDEAALLIDDEVDERSWEQVKADIERDRWTPPPGAKSALELLHEDRGRQT
jgi:hypothetical protein